MFVVDAGDNDDDDNGIHGKKFTLDDVFNDTFNPKLFYAQWISGMSICQFICMSVCQFVVISGMSVCQFVCVFYILSMYIYVRTQYVW